MPGTALPAIDLDLNSLLKAIPDARMRRGIRLSLLLPPGGRGGSAFKEAPKHIRESWIGTSWDRGNGAGAMATLRTAALTFLRLASVQSIRAGMQAVMLLLPINFGNSFATALGNEICQCVTEASIACWSIVTRPGIPILEECA